jgi:hypothetical protein
MGVYDLGDEVQYLGTFTDAVGTLTAPGTVRFVVAPPGLPGTAYAYVGGDGTILNPATGSYTYLLRYDRPGYWAWSWQGTGTINAMAAGRDFVRYQPWGSAAGPRYATLDDLRRYLAANSADPLDGDEDDLLTDCLLRAESQITQYTRRSFGTAQATKGWSRWTAEIVNTALYMDEDLYALDTLVNGDGQVIPVGSVWLEPRNEGPPYRIIRLKSAYVWTFNTDTEIAVTGAWGHSAEAPADVQQAAVRLAAYLYRQKDVGAMSDMAGQNEAGVVQIGRGMPDDVRYLLSPYRSRTGGVV